MASEDMTIEDAIFPKVQIPLDRPGKERLIFTAQLKDDEPRQPLGIGHNSPESSSLSSLLSYHRLSMGSSLEALGKKLDRLAD